MAVDPLTQINHLGDFEVLRFYEHWARLLFNDLDLDVAGMTAQLRATEAATALAPALEVSGSARQQALDFADSVECARTTLEAFAVHLDFRDAMSQALDDYRDEAMVAEVILAVGMAASMIIVAATTHFEVRYSNGHLSAAIAKDISSPKLVSAVLDPLAKIAQKLGNASGGSAQSGK